MRLAIKDVHASCETRCSSSIHCMVLLCFVSLGPMKAAGANPRLHFKDYQTGCITNNRETFPDFMKVSTMKKNVNKRSSQTWIKHQPSHTFWSITKYWRIPCDFINTAGWICFNLFFLLSYGCKPFIGSQWLRHSGESITFTNQQAQTRKIYSDSKYSTHRKNTTNDGCKPVWPKWLLFKIE